MPITKTPTSSHDEWIALRSKYIGGSDAAAVVGLNANCTPFSLWMEKTGQQPPFEGNLATKTGTFLEPFVAQLFEEQTGKKVRRENASLFNSDYPWAIANVDRERRREERRRQEAERRARQGTQTAGRNTGVRILHMPLVGSVDYKISLLQILLPAVCHTVQTSLLHIQQFCHRIGPTGKQECLLLFPTEGCINCLRAQRAESRFFYCFCHDASS